MDLLLARCLHRAKTWQRESVAAEISSPGAHGESAKTAFFIRRTHIRRPGAAVGFPAHVFICFQIEYSIYSSLERTNPAAVKPLQKTKKQTTRGCGFLRMLSSIAMLWQLALGGSRQERPGCKKLLKAAMMSF